MAHIEITQLLDELLVMLSSFSSRRGLYQPKIPDKARGCLRNAVVPPTMKVIILAPILKSVIEAIRWVIYPHM